MHLEVVSADVVSQDQPKIAHRGSSTPAVLMTIVKGNAEVTIRAKKK